MRSLKDKLYIVKLSFSNELQSFCEIAFLENKTRMMCLIFMFLCVELEFE